MSQLGCVLIPLLALASLYPGVSSGLALFVGIAIALTLGNPYIDTTRKITPKLLAYSIVGLGAGMNLEVVLKVGAQGIGYTAIGILLTMLLGLALGRAMKTHSEASLLLTSGTAICGGSAIAAVASVTHAQPAAISVALATVFFLNATALFIFPPLGHFFDLDQNAFGLWSALAIHDTSSVVGAALQYGKEALEVATTVKLARALWIVPLALGIGFLAAREKKGALKKPWFILGFVATAALVTWVPMLKPAGEIVAMIAKRGLVLTLFLIGCGLTRATLQSVGMRPMLQGVFLWIIVGSSTLAAILAGWIH